MEEICLVVCKVRGITMQLSLFLEATWDWSRGDMPKESIIRFTMCPLIYLCMHSL